jgi:hypothetical protein
VGQGEEESDGRAEAHTAGVPHRGLEYPVAPS